MPGPDPHGASPSVDVRIPNSARIYDYLLGGKDNFPSDRAAAEQLMAASPDVMEYARANRRFLRAAVRVAAEEGVRQFFDLGTGIPISPSVHEIARSVHPDARIVYVDNDPVVAAHNRAWRATQAGIVCVEADIREPGPILAHGDVTTVIDRAEPVAVIMAAVLHFTENPSVIVEAFREWMAPGSLLIISTATSEGVLERQRASVDDAYRDSATRLFLRTRGDVEAYFDGLEMLAPGIEEAGLWRDPGGRSFPIKVLAGVGRKPA